jgi:hypothetical protein
VVEGKFEKKGGLMVAMGEISQRPGQEMAIGAWHVRFP